MLRRHIASLIRSSLEDFPAVLLIGARQVGKSTLVDQLVEDGIINRSVSLDDFTTLNSATDDPDGFIQQFDNEKIAIDEVQRVPDLLRAIKKYIDRNPIAGKFLLTGSANILSYPAVSESLAGRVDIINLEGFSLGEILQKNVPSPFCKEMFNAQKLIEFIQYAQEHIAKPPLNSRNDLYQSILLGNFPKVILTKKISFAKRWFAAYQKTYIEKDVRDINKSIDIIPFSKLLKIIALQTGNLFVIKNITNSLNIDYRIVTKYLGILQLTFQALELYPWHANNKKRLIKTSKIYMHDSGMAANLINISSIEELIKSPFLGALAETWVFAELRKLLIYYPEIKISFYRTHQGKEVDFVLEQGEQICGIELKCSNSVSKNDFSGLMDLQNATKNFHLGIILYLGEEIVAFGDRLVAVPISILA